MAKRKHIEIETPGVSANYTSTSGGGSQREYQYPARNPGTHAVHLRGELTQAQTDAANAPDGLTVNGLVLEFFGANGCGLETDSLDDRVANIELLSQRTENGVTYASVFVPEGKIQRFFRKIEAYETETIDSGEPKNKTLMESLEGVRLPVVRSFWTDDVALFPAEVNQSIWWEVWLRRSAVETGHDDPIPSTFRQATQAAGMAIVPGVTQFPERIVFLVHGTATQWASSFSLLIPLAELRRASEIASDYVQLPPREQAAWVNAAVARITPPAMDAPAICVVDTGCNRAHPLLQPVIDSEDLLVWSPAWDTVDESGHGTEVAGIAVYGEDLAQFLSGSWPIALRHRLESVKFLNDHAPHDPKNYGSVTVEAVAIAEQNRPNRPRVVCMMTTTDKHQGNEPQLWSAALDQHSAGELDQIRRLYVVSVGNVRDYLNQPYAYPHCNRTMYGVEDPAQAYNVLSVGGYTRRVTLSAAHAGRSCIAPVDSLSPLSRTSMMWDDEDRSPWPLKPDIVMEAGNYLNDPNDRPEACDDVGLLTTRVAATGQLLTTTGDTSAATAQAAKLAAELMADYPTLWPETVRGLIVHSAEWTPAMMSEFPGSGRDPIRKRLRCYGYGVPNVETARFTANNHVSLIVQDSLHPFKKEGSSIKTNEYKLHALPWPMTVLQQLNAIDVTVRITLSYFIEPSPGRRGFTDKFRYGSHGLRFVMRGPTEADQAFEKRISKAMWTDNELLPNAARTVDRPATGEPQSWKIGAQVRTRGSIHRDEWKASAADVARAGVIAVHPVTGWWKERSNLKRSEQSVRYSLIVSLTTPDESIDLCTPILQQIAGAAEVAN